MAVGRAHPSALYGQRCVRSCRYSLVWVDPDFINCVFVNNLELGYDARSLYRHYLHPKEPLPHHRRVLSVFTHSCTNMHCAVRCCSIPRTGKSTQAARSTAASLP